MATQPISKIKVGNTEHEIDAVKVNGHTVEADVPASAKFTDTVPTITFGKRSMTDTQGLKLTVDGVEQVVEQVPLLNPLANRRGGRFAKYDMAGMLYHGTSDPFCNIKVGDTVLAGGAGMENTIEFEGDDSIALSAVITEAKTCKVTISAKPAVQFVTWEAND